MNLYGAFECAFHMFACMAQVLNFNIHACVVYASCRFQLQISFPSGIELTMMLRMVYWCTSIGITLQRSIFYTLASFGRNCLPYFLSKHMCKLQSKLLAHMQGEQLLLLEFMKLVHILLHMINMLGQATWIQLNFNLYLCERVVINYRKGGD